MIDGDPSLRRRAYLALVLAVSSLLLLWAYNVIPRAQAGNAVDRATAAKAIAVAVDILCTRHGFGPASIKTWRASAGGTSLDRIEQRIWVEPGFLSLLVNRELQSLVAPVGGHVVATERTKDNVVTMHIVRNGATVRSISFMMNPNQ